MFALIEGLEYDEISRYTSQRLTLERAKLIFGLAYLGFKLTFDKDSDACDLFIRIMYEANQIRYELLGLK